MLVLMDLEWLMIKGGRLCPTQTAAMHVDDNWNCIDRFDSLFLPLSVTQDYWHHDAYSGAKPEDFKNAPSAFSVMKKLFKWLNEDDVLCWWTEKNETAFRNLVMYLWKREVPRSMCVVYPLWQMHVTDGLSCKGTLYSLAGERGISVPSVQHVSVNNVEAFRALLQGTAFPSSFIRKPMSAEETSDEAEYKKTQSTSEAIPLPAVDLTKFALYYDVDKATLHRNDCPLLDPAAQLEGFDDFRICIQRKLIPCQCCSKEYWKANREAYQHIVSTCGFNYVYQTAETVFHRPNCVSLEQIPYTDVLGEVYYAKCLKKGMKPCELCKPTIKQQVGPKHVYAQDPQKRAQFNQNADDTWVTTRKLSKGEMTALTRHQVARNERAALEQSGQPKSYTELRDEHTLTQTRYAFWSAKGYQTFHTRNCGKLQNMNELRGFAKYNDAVRAGLTPCKLCKPSAKADINISVPIYQNMRKGESRHTLDRLCKAAKFKHHFESPNYYIETPVGKWRININTCPVDVHHANLVKEPHTQAFHKQSRLFLSLTDTFEYIRRHDTDLIKEQSKIREVSEPNKNE